MTIAGPELRPGKEVLPLMCIGAASCAVWATAEWRNGIGLWTLVFPVVSLVSLVWTVFRDPTVLRAEEDAFIAEYPFRTLRIAYSDVEDADWETVDRFSILSGQQRSRFPVGTDMSTTDPDFWTRLESRMGLAPQPLASKDFLWLAMAAQAVVVISGFGAAVLGWPGVGWRIGPLVVGALGRWTEKSATSWTATDDGRERCRRNEVRGWPWHDVTYRWSRAGIYLHLDGDTVFLFIPSGPFRNAVCARARQTYR